jgi:hypothetical protein
VTMLRRGGRAVKPLALGDKVTSRGGSRGVVMGSDARRIYDNDVWVLFEPYRPSDMVSVCSRDLRRAGRPCNPIGFAHGAALRFWGSLTAFRGPPVPS